MTIQKLIDLLCLVPSGTVFSEGFHNAHSYRGNYEDLGVEPASNVTVDSMISCLEQAIGTTYRGYKGGDFTMVGVEDVYLAYKGCSGKMIIGYCVYENCYELLYMEN